MAEAAFFKIRDIVNEGVVKAEDAIHHIMSIVTNKDKLNNEYQEATTTGKQQAESAKSKLKEEL